jgi:hypothetical protein
LPINDSIGYVTDLYGAKIHVINYQTGKLVTDISGVSKWTEHMLMVGSNLMVEEQNFEDTTGNASLAVISTVTNSFVQRFKFPGGNMNGLVKDADGYIWAAVDQDSIHSIPASLYCLNGDLSLHKQLVFAWQHHPSNLCINGGSNNSVLCRCKP